MTTPTDICRMALDHIGAKSIASIDEISVEAKACKRQYDSARDQTLRDYPWRFAERRELLASVTLTNYFGFEYAYFYPADCVRAIEIHRDDLSTDPIPFKIFNAGETIGKVILTNQEQAILVYTYRATNPGFYDSEFIVALSYRLAADIAMPITKKLDITNGMLSIYSAHIAAASRADAQEGHHEAVDHFTSFIDARN